MTAVIKEWEEMEREFGTLGFDGSIACDEIFLREMKFMCGKRIAIIPKRVGDMEWIETVGGISGKIYAISRDMIKEESYARSS